MFGDFIEERRERMPEKSKQRMLAFRYALLRGHHKLKAGSAWLTSAIGCVGPRCCRADLVSARDRRLTPAAGGHKVHPYTDPTGTAQGKNTSRGTRSSSSPVQNPTISSSRSRRYDTIPPWSSNGPATRLSSA